MMKKIQSACFFALCALTVSAAPSLGLALDEGEKAPEIALKDLSGKPVKLSDFKGKVVIVDFWASWCGPCRDSMPVFDKLSKAYKKQGLVVLGVNIDNDLKSANKFLRDVPVSFPVVNDAAKMVAKAYAPPTMPSSFIIDRHGKVRVVHAGFKASDAKQIEAEVKKLLASK